MDSSQSRSKNSKSKNWNIFRSPEQKDLFDFMDHQEKQELTNFYNKKENHNPNVLKNQPKHKRNQSTWKHTDTIKQENLLQNGDENSWRSNMTFATRYHEDESSKIKSLKNDEKFFRATLSRNSKKSILNQEEEEILLTSRAHCEDSLSNIFLKEITRTQNNQILSTEQQKKKLFENINLKTSDNFAITYLDNNLILKTLNEIKEINKENLFVNRQILSTMQRKSEVRSIKRGKTLNIGQQVVKSAEKKCSIQKNNNMASSKGFSQSKNQFYLYEKPAKISSNSKLSQKRTVLHKKLPMNNTTQFSNLTKYSINQNTTKLSLADRTLASNKAPLHTQSKSTIKKAKGSKKLSSIQIDDHIDQRINEIQKIKTSLNMVVKKGQSHQVPLEKTLSKTTNKKKSHSHFIIHS